MNSILQKQHSKSCMSLTFLLSHSKMKSKYFIWAVFFIFYLNTGFYYFFMSKLVTLPSKYAVKVFANSAHPLALFLSVD